MTGDDRHSTSRYITHQTIIPVIILYLKYLETLKERKRERDDHKQERKKRRKSLYASHGIRICCHTQTFPH